MSVNAARGEVRLVVDGKVRKLRLTLGALAEIESSLGCQDLKELDLRMRSLSATDLLAVLAALLRGGGDGAIASRIGEFAVPPGEAAKAVAQSFLLGLGE